MKFPGRRVKRTTIQRVQRYTVAVIGLATFLLAVVTLGLSLRGQYVADARFEIYWGTGKYLDGHLNLWDSVRNLGRPSPYFSPVIGLFVGICRTIGLSPAWSERFLHAAMIAVGAAGAAAVYRVFRPREIRAAAVCAAAFGFAPYVTEFLVPSGLFWHYSLAPWMLYAFIRGTTERRPWRFGGLFALCVFSLGAINPASLIFALTPIVPALVYVLFVSKQASWRDLGKWVFAAGTLTVLVIAAAAVSVAANGPVLEANLATTELPRTVNTFSSWSESWRGMGSWLSYFLGGGATAANPSALLTSRIGIAASWIVPVIAAVALWRGRSRQRVLFGAMLAISLIAMVGIFPPDASSPLGSALSRMYAAFPTTRGMRNGYKAGVGLALANAVLFGFAVGALIRWVRRRYPDNRRTLATNAVSVVAVVAALAGGLPFWLGQVYPPNETLRRIPTYWRSAVAAVNALPDDGRVLILPGTNRARYRWGYPGDDILDALLSQPHAARSSLPQGTPEAADLLVTLDAYATSPSYQPGVLAQIARRLGFKWVLLRNDLSWERIKAPRPSAFMRLRRDPAFTLVRSFGLRGQNVGGAKASTAERRLSPVELYEIADAPGLVQADSRPPLLVEGSGDSWPVLGTVGLLNQRGPVGYLPNISATRLRELLDDGASLVVTDGNRRRARRVTAERNYDGPTLALSDSGGERPPVPLFTDAKDQSAATYGAIASIEASTYGAPGDTFPMAFRPSNAFDGNPRTAWVVAGQQAYAGQWIRATLASPTKVTGLVIRQRRRPDNDPTVSRVRITFGNATTDRTLGYNLNPGQTIIDLPDGVITHFTVTADTVTGDNPSGIGFAEIDVLGQNGKRLPTEETIAVGSRQTDRSTAGGDTALLRRLGENTSYLFTRSRLNAPLDEEVDVRRSFDVTAPVSLNATMTLSITPATTDIVLDSLRNRPYGAYGSSRYQNDVAASTGQNALDSDPNTSWRFLPSPGENLSIRVPPGSAPKQITVRTPTADSQTVSTIASISVKGFRSTTGPDGEHSETLVFGGDDTTPVPISRECRLRNQNRLCLSDTSVALPGVPVDRIQIDVRRLEVHGSPLGRFPAQIVDVSIDGRFAPSAPGTRRPAGTCVDLLRIDDKTVAFTQPDPKASFTAGLPPGVYRSTSCKHIDLGAGSHSLATTLAAEGFVNTIELTPAASGTPRPSTTAVPLGASTKVRNTTRSGADWSVTASREAITTSGQAFGAGWFGATDGGNTVRAESWNTLSSWVVPEGTHRVRVSYQPQRWYVAAIAVTSLGLALSLALVLPGPRPRRRRLPWRPTANGGGK